jgi:hypothetical protein
LLGDLYHAAVKYDGSHVKREYSVINQINNEGGRYLISLRAGGIRQTFVNFDPDYLQMLLDHQILTDCKNIKPNWVNCTLKVHAEGEWLNGSNPFDPSWL